MEIVTASVVSVAIFIILLGRTLNLLWLKPKRAERCLREQGLKGTSYTLLLGDLKEIATTSTKARSKPININDDIVPRVIPFQHQLVKNCGMLLSILHLRLSTYQIMIEICLSSGNQYFHCIFFSAKNHAYHMPRSIYLFQKWEASVRKGRQWLMHRSGWGLRI